MRNVVFTPKRMTPEELQAGVQKMYHVFYNPTSTLRRIIQNLHYGIHTVFVVFMRSIVATISSRSLFSTQKKKI